MGALHVSTPSRKGSSSIGGKRLIGPRDIHTRRKVIRVALLLLLDRRK